jgi:hypothetical protein
MVIITMEQKKRGKNKVVTPMNYPAFVEELEQATGTG